MTNKIFFLVLAILCLVLYVISLFVGKNKMKEGFYNSPSSSPSNTPTPSPSTTPAMICQPAMPISWWDATIPTQIIALSSGLRFPILSTNLTPGSGINYDFQIPVIKPGNTIASGCIGIDDNGTYKSIICNKDDNHQLWTIKYIRNESDFTTILNANINKYSTGINRITNTNIVLPLGVQYGFFMVISKFNPSLALASNGGNLTVQTVGNFISQFWDITNQPGQPDIAIYKTNEFTNLDTNYTGSINPLMPLNANAGNIYKATGQDANAGPNQSNPTLSGRQINLNINLSSDGLSLGVPSGINSSTATNTSESFAEANDCPVCPSILTDYIAKKNIPCYGCTL